MEPSKADLILANEVRKREKEQHELVMEQLSKYVTIDLIDEMRRRGYEVKLREPAYDERKFN